MKTKIFLIVLLAISAYFLYMQNESINSKLHEITVLKAETDKQANIDKCMASNYSNYQLTWNNTCKSNSLPNDCSLSVINSTDLNKTLNDNDTNCINRYK